MFVLCFRFLKRRHFVNKIPNEVFLFSNCFAFMKSCVRIRVVQISHTRFELPSVKDIIPIVTGILYSSEACRSSVYGRSFAINVSAFCAFEKQPTVYLSSYPGIVRIEELNPFFYPALFMAPTQFLHWCSYCRSRYFLFKKMFRSSSPYIKLSPPDGKLKCANSSRTFVRINICSIMIVLILCYCHRAII